MLELTYLVLAKPYELKAIQNEDVVSYLLNEESGGIELQVPVEADTTAILADYLTKNDTIAIETNNVKLIRFYV